MKVISIYKTLQPRSKLYPLFASPVSAGFPSPADDYIEQDIDLHEYLVKNPPATFLVRAEGDSMIGAGIFSGDILIVDKSLSPQDGNVVIAVVDGDLTVKRFLKSKKGIILAPENGNYEPIILSNEDELTIWGVVTNVIHSLK